MAIVAIRSGGQSGADQAGLAAGVTLGLETGGWAPRGFRTDEGPAPWLADLGVKEHHSPTYPPRTRLNVEENDGTLVFGNRWSPGCKLTIQLATDLDKPWIHIPWRTGDPLPDSTPFLRWVAQHDIRSLNVAGNRERRNPGITKACHAFLVGALL